MNTMIGRIKSIVIVLTFLNIGLGGFGLSEGLLFVNCIATFVLIELVILLLYLLVVTYRWVDLGLKKINKKQTEDFSAVLERMASFETLVGQLNKDVENEMRSKFQELSLGLKELGNASDRKLSELSENISSEQISIKEELKEKSAAQISMLEKNKEELKQSLSQFTLLQHQLKDQVNENSVEQLSIQQDVKSALVEAIAKVELLQQEIKSQIHAQSLKQLSDQQELLNVLADAAANTTLLQHQLKDQVNDKSVEQLSVQQDAQKSLAEASTKVELFQQEIKAQIHAQSVEQISVQQELRKFLLIETASVSSNQQAFSDQIDEKISDILLRQQTINKQIEASGQKTIELSSDVIKALDHKTSNINYNLVKQLNFTYDRVDALFSIYNLIALNAPLPIMHEWRISSDYAHRLLTRVIGKKGSVIDLGSGISTLLMGYAMKKNGAGKVISLEHDEEYYAKTVQLIKEHQLEAWCHVSYCPLKTFVLDGKDWLWYDIAKVDFPKDIILISADGPPGVTQYMARYPALPLLKQHITKDTVIMLDDGDRDEEKEIALRWSQEFKLKNIKNKSHKGFFELLKP
jgi:hypothetical protein